MATQTAERPALMLRVAEAANLMGISRSKTYELISRGELPGIRRIGSAVRINRQVLEAWLAEPTVGA
jgi:excisionase family DNA binding protein